MSQNPSSERASEHLRPSDNPVYMDSYICQLSFLWARALAVPVYAIHRTVQQNKPNNAATA